MVNHTHESGGVSRRGFISVVGAGALIAPLVGAADATLVSKKPVAEPTALGVADFADPELHYLNNATLGCTPGDVFVVMMDAARKIEANPADEAFGPYIERMEAARAKAASFLGCAVESLAITNNTTNGMNLVAQGIDLREGDRVLTTNQEHPGGLACWEYYAKRRGVVIDRVELPLDAQRPKQITDLFAAKLTKATKVVSVSHVTYATGHRLPIKAIAAAAKASGALVVVDGAQAPGVLDVNVTDLGCHAYATSTHKGTLAPKGTGLLYISPDAKDRIDPMALQFGMNAYTGSTGTRNIPAIIGLGAAIDYLTKLGKPAIEAHVMKMRQRLLEKLAGIPDAKVASPPAGELASSIVALVPPDKVDVYALQKTLREKHKVIVSAKDVVRCIRISLHLYNGERDVDAVAAALRTELA